MPKRKKKNPVKYQLKFYAYSDKLNLENQLFVFNVPNIAQANKLLSSGRFKRIRSAWFHDLKKGVQQRLI